MKLSAQTIKTLTLPPGMKDRIFFDDEVGGFGIRLRDSGEARWIVQYDDPSGRTRKVTLGSPSLLDAAAARKAARDLLASIRLGADPAAERQTRREQAAETFGGPLLSRYLAYQQGRRRPRSFLQLERHLRKNAKPLHAYPLVLIDRRTVAGLISRLVEENGPTAALNARGSIVQFLTWCVREGLIEHNAAANTNAPTTNGPRTRLLNEDDLRAIWGALPDPGDDFGDLVRLLAYTLTRRAELGDLLWDEVDLEAGEIKLPAARMKNNKPHIIVLSKPALAILAARPRNGRAHVFGRNEHGFQNWAYNKARLDKRTPNVEVWNLHDFRRLGSTTMHDELGIPPHVVEVVLAHVGHRAGVAGVYNLAAYLPERRRAMERWAERVDAVVSGRGTASAEVVQLRR
jgi:integrase